VFFPVRRYDAGDRARARRGAAMPTLEDTVDFKVVTLNDLLDADVRTGVPAAADDRYKRWAFLSTGVAGMLLVALIVALVTGGGSDSSASGSTKSIAAPPNTTPIGVSAGAALNPGVEVGATVSILDSDGKVVASGGKVLQITEAKALIGKGTTKTVSVAVANDEVGPVNAAESAGHVKVVAGTLPKATTTTTAVASTVPIPIQPAPTTPPHS
jgi:hypothetical protein